MTAKTIANQVIGVGFSLIQTSEIIAVKKGPEDRINKVEATDVYIIENTYPEKDIDKKIPTIRSLESKPLIKFERD
jgi:hypothetical protein|tara:strand:- start:1546 stop:1773 length:228 start_codon:yes stop_codon:yes gene_type:complete